VGTAVVVVGIAAGSVHGQAAATYVPPTLVSGNSPSALPPLSQVVGGGEVALEVTVDASGAASTIDVLRTTPPYTDLLLAAVRSWRFEPAREETMEPATDGRAGAPTRVNVPSKVLVFGINNSPTVLGPSLATPPATVKSASPEVAFPSSTSSPPTAPNSTTSVIMLLEVRVGADGRVENARILRSAASYDQLALSAVRGWSFRAARRGNRTVPSMAYVVFGFPIPTNAGR
jgi:TonB family protein